jgi:hypothetical protein
MTYALDMSTDERLQPPTTPANQNIRVVSNLIAPMRHFRRSSESVDRAAGRQRVWQVGDVAGVSLAGELEFASTVQNFCSANCAIPIPLVIVPWFDR